MWISPPRMAPIEPASRRPKTRSKCWNGKLRQTEAAPRQRAGIIARLTRAAHLRTHRIDRARGGHADLAAQRRAAIAVAAHRPAGASDGIARDRFDFLFGREAEARPLGRIRAAGAARLAQRLVRGAHYFSSSSSSIGTPPGSSVPSASAPASAATEADRQRTSL